MNSNIIFSAGARVNAKPASFGQRGFSMVELMVALLIGLIIMVALWALFANIGRSNSELAKTNSQIENGRFAIQLIQDDLLHAGYWGGHVPQFDDLTATGIPGDVPTAVPDPCLAYASWDPAHKNNLVGIPVQVYGGTPPSGSGCVTNFSTNRQTNTDVLVVRRAETCVAGSGGNCEADTAGKLYFQAPFCAAQTGFVLDTTNFTMQKKNCVGTGSPPALPIVTPGDTADKRKFVSNIYYIRNYASTVGDGIPTLMRSSFDLSGGNLAHQSAQPLIEGIEGFHVELGVDNLSETGAAVNYAAAINWQDTTNLTTPTNRGDGVPDGTFVSCTSTTPCTTAQLSNVVAAKVFVLARAKESSPGYVDTKTYNLGSVTMGPFNDGFKRHVFSTTVRLTNVSGRRETP